MLYIDNATNLMDRKWKTWSMEQLGNNGKNQFEGNTEMLRV
jgi:hypothetical protein